MPLLSDGRLSSSNTTMSSDEISKDPAEVLAEAEQQWMYSEEDLLHTPSILDGMPPDEERQLRSKGTNFITQVGIMLKLPQTTLCTASIFFNRFLMRQSLVKKEGHKPLHHYVSRTLFDLQGRGNPLPTQVLDLEEVFVADNDY